MVEGEARGCENDIASGSGAGRADVDTTVGGDGGDGAGELGKAVGVGGVRAADTNLVGSGNGESPGGSAAIAAGNDLPPAEEGEAINPAKLNSLIPSGNGITAANECDGGPPTKTLTFNGSPILFAFV